VPLAPPTPAETDAKIAAKAASLARAGERGKGWQALAPAVVADTSTPAVRRAFVDLTPQTGTPIPPDLLTDVPGVAPLRLDKDKFDKAVASAPRLRAPGTLYNTYEIYILLCRLRGQDGLYTFANAACAGLLHPDIVDVLTCLRAVALYKDEECTSIRPLGIGEALRRIISRCFAAQERGKWARFFTEALPEDAALNQTKIDETTAAADVARASHEAAVAAGSPDITALHTRLTRALDEQ
jgi:hypothetical protein